MRLIDADALDTRERGNNSQRTMWWEIDRLIRNAPTVDPVCWISVDDRLPETESDVFVVTRSKNGSTNVDKGYYSNGRWVHRGTAEVIFWMPIPEPPKVDEN